ncbi:hypothetical protein [Bradyrhizobium sp.]|uniref:hypothetical protein n=1 Tax=Bradyrhizobium sp. TaxID=376 RepID=UPI0039E23AE3
MSSRALSLATVLLLIGFGATDAANAQAQNLEAGKTPSQLFAQTCNACHKSPRGLLKTVAPGSLPGFLRQHYTTSSDMAGVLASYLVSNGATDTRYQAKDGKDGKDKKEGAKEKDANTNPAQGSEHQGRRQRSQEAARPEGEGAAPGPEGARQKRQARPNEEGAREGEAAAGEGRKSKRLSKRGKPETDEAPKVDTAAPAADDKKAEPKSDSVKADEPRSESSKATEKPAEAKPDSVKVEPSAGAAPAARPDPVPPVTPAPPPTAKPAEAPAAKPAESTTSGSSEPAAKPQEPARPATAAAPTPAPADASGGPPAPPISR